VRTWLALAALLASLAADAKTKTRSPPKKQDPRTIGLGRSCKKRVDCKGRGNVCIKLADAHGKEQPQGFCALPCSPLDMRPAKTQSTAKTARGADAGTAVAAPDAGIASRAGRADAGTPSPGAQPRPATPAEIAAAAKRKPASRCPPRYQCRSQGAGVPIDLCVKE
jgi:hypothetical protein